MHSWAFSKTRFSTGLFRSDASQGYKLKKTFSSDLWKVSSDLWKMYCDLWKMYCDLWKMYCDRWKMYCDLWKMYCDLWEMYSDLWKMFSDLWKLALRKFVFADFQIDFRKLPNSNEQIFCIWITGNQDGEHVVYAVLRVNSLKSLEEQGVLNILLKHVSWRPQRTDSRV